MRLRVGWVTPGWRALLIAMSALLVAVLVVRLVGWLTTAESIDVFLVASLVLVTALYAAETARMRVNSENQAITMSQQAFATQRIAEQVFNQTLASQRPFLIPRERINAIMALFPIGTYPKVVEEHGWLTLKNIGSGPASNISFEPVP